MKNISFYIVHSVRLNFFESLLIIKKDFRELNDIDKLISIFNPEYTDFMKTSGSFVKTEELRTGK